MTDYPWTNVYPRSSTNFGGLHSNRSILGIFLWDCWILRFLYSDCFFELRSMSLGSWKRLSSTIKPSMGVKIEILIFYKEMFFWHWRFMVDHHRTFLQWENEILTLEMCSYDTERAQPAAIRPTFDVKIEFLIFFWEMSFWFRKYVRLSSDLHSV